MYTLHFVYSSIHQWAFGLDIFATVNNAAMNVRVHISVWVFAFNSLGYVPSRGIASPYLKSMFNFWRNHHIVFSSSYTVLQPPSTPTAVHDGSNFFTSSPTLFCYTNHMCIKWYNCFLTVATLIPSFFSQAITTLGFNSSLTQLRTLLLSVVHATPE